MMSQFEMFDYLKKNSTSHEYKIKKNKIVAKRLITWCGDSFLGFTLNYLKNGEVSLSLNVPSATRRFDNDRNLICDLGAISDVK